MGNIYSYRNATIVLLLFTLIARVDKSYLYSCRFFY